MPVRSRRGILDRLQTGVVLGAEGYVFELERRGYIKAGPYVPEGVLDFPHPVRELHREVLRAGADAMGALTYYAYRAAGHQGARLARHGHPGLDSAASDLGWLRLCRRLQDSGGPGGRHRRPEL